MFLFPFALGCMALVASTQGAAVGQIEDIAFEFEGQEFHLSPIEKRQANTSEVGATLNKKNTNSDINNNNNNNAQCQTVNLPASLQLKVCGCKNPGCPSCPCGGANNNEGVGDWDDEEEDNRNRNSKNTVPTKKPTNRNTNN